MPQSFQGSCTLMKTNCQKTGLLGSSSPILFFLQCFLQLRGLRLLNDAQYHKYLSFHYNYKLYYRISDIVMLDPAFISHNTKINVP